MKFVRFAIRGDTAVRNGVLEGDVVKETSGDLFSPPQFTGKTYAVDAVRLRAPLVPRHIIGIGKNFVPEGAEKPPIPDMPILFFKPLTSVIGPDDAVLLPAGTDKIKFESELAVIIGREAKNLKPAEVKDATFGYTVANDVTAFNYFHPDGHWTIGKAFDTFSPIGPAIETELDLGRIRIQARVNGELKQDAPLERMIMPIGEMISYISRFMTLMPGDVILTGSPAGSDFVGHGDTVECRIDGIGSLVNPFVSPDM